MWRKKKCRILIEIAMHYKLCYTDDWQRKLRISVKISGHSVPRSVCIFYNNTIDNNIIIIDNNTIIIIIIIDIQWLKTEITLAPGTGTPSQPVALTTSLQFFFEIMMYILGYPTSQLPQELSVFPHLVFKALLWQMGVMDLYPLNLRQA